MFRSVLTVEWGDCDEAGIVFYPNYFYWFDCTFQRLLRSRGLSQRAIRARFGAVTPIVDVGAQFRSPARYDDELSVEASVEDWQERRFRVRYAFAAGERQVADGFEWRAWAIVGQDGLRGAPVPAEFRAALT